jgi:hypothetical protein
MTAERKQQQTFVKEQKTKKKQFCDIFLTN